MDNDKRKSVHIQYNLQLVEAVDLESVEWRASCITQKSNEKDACNNTEETKKQDSG